MFAVYHHSLHMFDGRTLVCPGVEDTIWLCDTRQFVTYTGTLAFSVLHIYVAAHGNEATRMHTAARLRAEA